jgi:hypothetical protein
MLHSQRNEELEKYIWDNIMGPGGLRRPLSLEDFDDYISNGFIHDAAKPNHNESNRIATVARFQKVLEQVNEQWLKDYMVIYSCN